MGFRMVVWREIAAPGDGSGLVDVSGTILVFASTGLVLALAGEGPVRNNSLLGIGSGYFETSDRYQYLELFANYRNHRRDLYWPYQESDSRAMDWGLDTTIRSGSLASDFAVLYGLSPDLPWVWVGAGIYYQVFEFQTDGYWSPSQYHSFGPRLEASFPISPKLTGEAGVNLNVVSEDRWTPLDFSEFGGYISLGLDYSIGKGTHLKIGITHQDSIRDDFHYYETAAIFSLHRPLF